MSVKNAILITGAGQRLGEFLARKFLAAGEFPLVFTYRTEHPAVAELIELGAIGIQADFCETGAVEKLIAELNQQVKSYRAIIHNASLWLKDAAPKALENQWKVHVDAPFALNLALAEKLRASSSDLKDIISITDAMVERGQGDEAAYFASKAALQNMAKSFAQKFAPEIKVNDIAPALLKFNTWDSEAHKTARLKESLIQIEPGFEVVWQAVEYLLNSPYTTGTILKLDGGRMLV